MNYVLYLGYRVGLSNI